MAFGRGRLVLRVRMTGGSVVRWGQRQAAEYAKIIEGQSMKKGYDAAALVSSGVRG